MAKKVSKKSPPVTVTLKETAGSRQGNDPAKLRIEGPKNRLSIVIDRGGGEKEVV